MSIENLTMNPFTKIGKEWALVSAGDAASSNTMTVSWGGVGVLWGVNVVYIFIRESRHTKGFVDNGDTFSLAFLGDEYRQALSYCGSHSGRDGNKWEAAGLTPAEKDGVVYPAEASLVFLCRKMAAVPVNEDSFIDADIQPKWYGDHDMHTMYVGQILDVIEK
ncbi:MAG: flavin reductase [Lachnospiraceae bacterium]|nr:flavin reductase [Lachnospiraceae bacterium]